MRAVIARHGLGSWVDLPGPGGPGRAAGDLPPSADVYVAPARLESFGIAAIEARAAGLPVVARADSGVREFVQDGVEGLLAGSDEAMVDALVRLVMRSRSAATDLPTTTGPCRRVQDWPSSLGRADEEYARAARILAAAA